MSIGTISAHGYELTDNNLFKSNKEGNQFIFEIPMYQRPYVWRKDNWEDLFNDITDNESGYFIGAIICINHGADISNNYTCYEVVDGQQRLTTLSLFLSAIYKELIDRKEILRKELSSEEFEIFLENNSGKFTQLKNSLIISSGGGKFRTRVFPQNKDNVDDYLNILISAKLITEETLDYKEKIDKNPDGRRLHLITKAYEYFTERIVEYAEGYNGEYKDDTNNQIDRILEILSKVNSAQLVMIVADSHLSANILFETLNNRGTPLTITDLIKNRLLSVLEKNCDKKEFEKYSKQFIDIIDGVTKKNGKDIPAGEQERFFRHGYNAFRTEWNLKYPSADKKIPTFPIGKRATLYESYIKMIEFEPVTVYEQIKNCAKIYPLIQGITGGKNISTSLEKAYQDLSRINGTTSYTLLLYLVKNQELLKLNHDDFEKICKLLISFFIRHAFTDTPPSNMLDPVFINFIEDIEKNNYKGDSIRENLARTLKEAYGKDDNDERLKSRLNGDVYAKGSANTAIRFVLVKLAEYYLDKEPVDLWKKSHNENKSDFYNWTIEHILPQTLTAKNLTSKKKSWIEDWIKMLADGDESKALEVQSDNVNKLGNLTLTASNAELGNRPFADKKTMKGGYLDSILANNLNSYICAQEVWSAEQVQARTNLLIKDILKIFAW